MITKKISLKEVVPSVLFLIISSFIFSCGGGSNEKEQVATSDQAAGTDDKRSSEEAISSRAPVKDDVAGSPIYVGGPKFKKMFVDDFKANNNNADPIPYDRKKMMWITVPYIKRLKRAGNHRTPPPGLDEHVGLNEEQMLVYLDGKTLKDLLNDSPDATGLIAIFATDRDNAVNNGRPKHQTFILVPYDTVSKSAVTSGTNQDVVGYQRWPTAVGHDVSVEPLTNGNIEQNVDAVFDSLGI
jgi:hypothetical protein